MGSIGLIAYLGTLVCFLIGLNIALDHIYEHNRMEMDERMRRYVADLKHRHPQV